MKGLMCGDALSINNHAFLGKHAFLGNRAFHWQPHFPCNKPFLFVIPSEAEGSAVQRTFRGNVFPPLEREPRHKLQLPHPGERTAEDIVDLTVPRTIDAGVAGIAQVGMVECVLCLHFQFH